MKRWVKIACVAAIIAAVGAACARSEPEGLVEYRYTVQPGDTVWGVCSRIASDRDNLQQVVWQTMKDSHIEKGNRLQPGQELIVRVKGAAE